jgi:hypothetical protein
MEEDVTRSRIAQRMAWHNLTCLNYLQGYELYFALLSSYGLDCCYRIAVSVVKGYVLPSRHRLRCCFHPSSCVARIFVTPFCSFDVLLQSATSSKTHHHSLRAARLVLYDFSP